MSAQNLQVQIQAMAIQARIDGMKADNAIRYERGECFSYGESDFDEMANQLDALLNEVSF